MTSGPETVLIGGRYSLTTRDKKGPGILGEGSFGAVYRGIDIEVSAAVAIKLECVRAKHPQLSYENRVLEELRGTPGIPRVLYFGEYGDTHLAMVMDRLGRTVGSDAPLSKLDVAHIARSVLSILHIVHLAGFVHRDIKPENLLWPKGDTVDTGRAQVHLIDFGLCKRVLGEDGRHIPLRTDKSFLGTPEYASARAHTGEELSRRDDIESLVYVLLYLHTKQLPWRKRDEKDRAGDAPAPPDIEDALVEGDCHHAKIGRMKAWALADMDNRLFYTVENNAIATALRCTLIYARNTLAFTDMPNYSLLEKYWSTKALLNV
jgi:serine/threonine protein kinase